MSETPSWQELLELIEQLTESDYENASVQFGDVSVRLSKNADFADAAPIAHDSSVATPSASNAAPSASAAPVVQHGDTIDAPMIGVFYRRPSPGADPFVNPGDHVDADTTIGIIEIMKLMNPVPAGKAGVIGEFLVEDAAAVEFGQPLAAIDIAG